MASGSSKRDNRARHDSFPTKARDRPKDVLARMNAAGEIHTTLLAATVKAGR